jgi:hypothetical protein
MGDRHVSWFEMAQDKIQGRDIFKTGMIFLIS